MTAEGSDNSPRRAVVLHETALLVDLIELTLNHGLFVVRAAHDLADAEAIVDGWRPHIGVVDMDHGDSTALLQRLGNTNALARDVVLPVLGLTRRGDLQTKLKAFDLGVDDILTVPFSPEELLARCMVLARRASGTDRPIVPTITLGEIEIDIVHRQVRAGSSVIHLSGIVDRHIRSLRIKLQNDYRHPRFIATVPGVGYRFIPTFSNTGWGTGAEPTEHRSGDNDAGARPATRDDAS
jgi:DNA-binding response OmpR family regulator